MKHRHPRPGMHAPRPAPVRSPAKIVQNPSPKPKKKSWWTVGPLPAGSTKILSWVEGGVTGTLMIPGIQEPFRATEKNEMKLCHALDRLYREWLAANNGEPKNETGGVV